jgi:SAM-dependent methyltransferase
VSYSGAKASFNSAADDYDAARPSYPSAVIRRILQRSGLPAGARILEVGAGTGKASLLFAQRGYSMLCLEPGIQMGEILRRNLSTFPRVQVETTTFEDWPVERDAFDLVISAQAFHWIDPEIGYTKSAEALKPGGWIALFWNLSNDPADRVYAEIQEAYHRHAPDMERRQRVKSLTEEVNEMREKMASFSVHFPWRYVYRTAWNKRYSADAYIRLLGTYSDHIALPDDQRERLYGAIRGVLAKHGGSLVKNFSTMVAMGRKCI